MSLYTEEELTLDPAELLPGDFIVRVEDHEEDGCHCDVRVTVLRMTEDGTALRQHGAQDDQDDSWKDQEALYTAWEVIGP